MHLWKRLPCLWKTNHSPEKSVGQNTKKTYVYTCDSVPRLSPLTIARLDCTRLPLDSRSRTSPSPKSLEVAHLRGNIRRSREKNVCAVPPGGSSQTQGHPRGCDEPVHRFAESTVESKTACTCTLISMLCCPRDGPKAWRYRYCACFVGPHCRCFLAGATSPSAPT